MVFPHPQRQVIVQFLKELRQKIISSFEQLEPSDIFKKTAWKYHQEGGGEMAVIKGKVFEKGAVNWSGVGGPSFPMSDSKGAFFATGVSLITHMSNPHMPTAHFNIRFIETEEKAWFGGGYDLTPMGFPYEEDASHFHAMAKKALDPFGESLYPLFSQNAREYFYIPHRKKERGVGGIFFDHLSSHSFENDLSMWQAVGHSFLEAIMPIYQRRMNQPFNDEEKEKQLRLRAHYVEFNLLYDRGTKFGFQSGGNPDAILCSMPPVVKWD